MTAEQLIAVRIHSTAKLDDVWEAKRPAGYEVSIEEPLAKSDGTLGFLTVPTVTVIVALVQSGLADWFVGKQADHFWNFLKAGFGKIGSPLGRKGTLKVTVPTDKGPGLTVEMDRMDGAAIDSIRATVQERISTRDRESKQEIYIKMK